MVLRKGDLKLKNILVDQRKKREEKPCGIYKYSRERASFL